MIDERIAQHSARRVAPVFVDIPDDELQARHLIATHARPAPDDFGWFDVQRCFDPASDQHATLQLAQPAATLYKGLDYSGARPSMAVLQQNDIICVFRYDDYSELGPGGNWKRITSDERSMLHGAGVGWKPNAEITGSEPFGGKAAAQQYAPVFARTLQSMGVPGDAGIGDLYSMDTSVNDESAMQAVIAFALEYDRIMRDNGYWAGLYGQYWVMLRLAQVGLRGWQTYAWSGGLVWDALACQREGLPTSLAIPAYQWNNSQVVGGVAELDLNWIYDPYGLGAWWPAGSPFATGDTSMTAQEVADLKTFITANNGQLVKAVADAVGGYAVPWGDQGGHQPLWAILRAAGMASQSANTQSTAIAAGLGQLQKTIGPLGDDEQKILASIAALPTNGFPQDQVPVLAQMIADQFGTSVDLGALTKAVAHDVVAATADALTKGGLPDTAPTQSPPVTGT